MTVWFSRLADVPGVGYSGFSGIDRSQLPGHDAMPHIERYTSFDGEQRESLEWPSPEGETSASPVDQYLSSDSGWKDQTGEAIIKRLREALELPGEPIDYHFAIQSCIEEMRNWKRRRSQPELLAEVEQLCWLDIRLIDALPHTIAFDHRGEQRYYAVAAFGHLIELYEREGFLQDALDVARGAARFHPDYPKVRELEERVARVASETAG